MTKNQFTEKKLLRPVFAIRSPNIKFLFHSGCPLRITRLMFYYDRWLISIVRGSICKLIIGLLNSPS